MTDLVVRLRTIVDDYAAADEMSYHADMLAGGCQVAADEIENLRSELEKVKATNELLMREPPHGYTNMPNGTVVPYWLYPVKPTKKGTDQ